MSFRKFISSAAASVLMLFAALPAHAGIPAGIPVTDGGNLAQAIQQVFAWGKQARQMLDQYNKLQEQYSQLQAMTGKLDGARSLGTILNDPSIRTSLPPEMRDSTYLLLNPSTPATSAANLAQIRTSFGVNTAINPNAGAAAADTLGRAQQILASTQTRQTQLQALATRVDTTADAKDSLDMMNRNVLEAASINNQMTQTMASLEASRQAAELRRLAENQTFFSNLNSGAGRPLKTYTY